MINLILLAAGKSSRFGENKLLYKLDGKRMFEYILDAVARIRDYGELPINIVIVSAYREILAEAAQRKLLAVKNNSQDRGISHSVKLGLSACGDGAGEYYLFSVCDQPYLRPEELEAFLKSFLKSGKGIGCMAFQGVPKNPVIFGRRYREELFALEGDKGGKAVLRRHEEDVFFYEVKEKRSLKDIDRMEEAGE